MLIILPLHEAELDLQGLGKAPLSFVDPTTSSALLCGDWTIPSFIFGQLFI